MKPKKILTILLSAVLATSIVGCNNDVGSSGSGANLQKTNATMSLSTATNSNAGSVAYMYKGAPIAANRQLIFEADNGQSISHITTTNPDANGKVYAIIVVQKNAIAQAGTQGYVYKVDLTANNPIDTKQIIDTFNNEMPLVSGFFSDGSGIVATSAGLDSTETNVDTPPPFSFYKGYQFSGKNGSFFKEQVRSISVSADDELMYIATSHHLYQTSKAKIDALSANFDSPAVNSQPFTDLTDVDALLAKTNDSIQAISFDSQANGYMVTTNGNLYTLVNSQITNESSPVQLIKPSDNAPYVTSINFENPIYSRAITKGNENDTIRTNWANEQIPSDIFPQMDSAAEPGLLFSYSCGNTCVKQVINAEANAMNPGNTGGFGLGGMIGDAINGNWGMQGFAGDLIMMGVQMGIVEAGETAIESLINRETDSAITVTGNKMIAAAEQQQRLENLAEVQRKAGVDEIAVINKKIAALDANSTEINQILQRTQNALDNAQADVDNITNGNISAVNSRGLRLFRANYAASIGFKYTDEAATLFKTPEEGVADNNAVRDYTVRGGTHPFLNPDGSFNPEFKMDLATTQMIMEDRINSLQAKIDRNNAKVLSLKDCTKKLLNGDLQPRLPDDVKDLINDTSMTIDTLQSINTITQQQLDDAAQQIAKLRFVKYAIYSGIILNSLGFSSVSDFMGSSGSNNNESGSISTVSLTGQTADQAKHAHGFISGSFLSLNDRTLYTSSESGGFDMLQDSQNDNLDNIGMSVAFDGKTQYTVVAYAPPGQSTRLLYTDTSASSASIIGGDWKDSCDALGTSVTKDNNGDIIAQASCKDPNGVYQTSSIDVSKCGGNYKVTNRNGFLMCNSDSKPTNVLGGNWSDSCAYVKYDPNTHLLSAFCGDGGDTMTSIDVNSCGGRGAQNDHGVLKCN